MRRFKVYFEVNGFIESENKATAMQALKNALVVTMDSSFVSKEFYLEPDLDNPWIEEKRGYLTKTELINAWIRLARRRKSKPYLESRKEVSYGNYLQKG